MKIKYLIIDPFKSIEDLEKEEDDVFCAVQCVDTESAEAELKTDANVFVAIFLNDEIGKKEAIKLIKLANKHQPDRPLFILSNNKIRQFTHLEIKNFKISGFVTTPVHCDEIRKKLTPLNKKVNVERLLDFSKQTADKVDEELSETDENFAAISSKNFLSGTKSFFDVYIRLRADHYVKFVNAGELYDKAQTENYLKKGIKHFYIRKEAQEEYLRFCDRISKKIISDNRISKEAKVEQTLNFGEQAREFLKQNGIKPENLKIADQFTSKVKTLVDSLDFKNDPDFGPFLNNLQLYDHGTSISIIMGLMLHQLQMSSEKAVQIVGMASFLHDVGLTLNDLPEDRQKLLVTDQINQLTEEEREIYYDHPRAGAELLEDNGKVHPTVYQIVKEHHMTRGENSFPAMKRAHTHYLAELIGISDELLNVMELVATGKERHHPLEVMEHSRFEYFSGRCVEIFIRSFGLKRG